MGSGKMGSLRSHLDAVSPGSGRGGGLNIEVVVIEE